jgi:hypothetical protein
MNNPYYFNSSLAPSISTMPAKCGSPAGLSYCIHLGNNNIIQLKIQLDIRSSIVNCNNYFHGADSGNPAHRVKYLK